MATKLTLHGNPIVSQCVLLARTAQAQNEGKPSLTRGITRFVTSLTIKAEESRILSNKS